MASTVWRGYVSFGLISIPVRLFRAARAERVSFRRLHRPEAEQAPPREKTAVYTFPEPDRARTHDVPAGDQRTAPEASVAPTLMPRPILSPIQQASVRAGSGEILPVQSVVKGYEFEKDRFVVIKPEELKSAASITSTQMEIQEFVRLAEIDPVFFETSYYVTPEAAGEKAYALLYRALQTTGLVGIAQFAMHSREHVVVLRAGKTGMVAHTMFFAPEVRAEEEYRADTSAVASKELELAQTLIHSLVAPFEPEKYRDTYRERLESIIAKKVQGEPVAPVAAVQQPAGVVDIADALRRSLANLKKPATSEEQPRKTTQTASRAKKTSRGAAK